MFLWTILQKDNNELVRKVYEAQKLFPTKDDFINKIIEDCDDIGLEWDENFIKNLKKNMFKVMVKNKLTLPRRGYRFCGSEGGASEAPPKKSIMEWAETPCCYRQIVKV